MGAVATSWVTVGEGGYGLCLLNPPGSDPVPAEAVPGRGFAGQDREAILPQKVGSASREPPDPTGAGVPSTLTVVTVSAYALWCSGIAPILCSGVTPGIAWGMTRCQASPCWNSLSRPARAWPTVLVAAWGYGHHPCLELAPRMRSETLSAGGCTVSPPRRAPPPPTFLLGAWEGAPGGRAGHGALFPGTARVLQAPALDPISRQGLAHTGLRQCWGALAWSRAAAPLTHGRHSCFPELAAGRPMPSPHSRKLDAKARFQVGQMFSGSSASLRWAPRLPIMVRLHGSQARGEKPWPRVALAPPIPLLLSPPAEGQAWSLLPAPHLQANAGALQ